MQRPHTSSDNFDRKVTKRARMEEWEERMEGEDRGL